MKEDREISVEDLEYALDHLRGDVEALRLSMTMVMCAFQCVDKSSLGAFSEFTEQIASVVRSEEGYEDNVFAKGMVDCLDELHRNIERSRGSMESERASTNSVSLEADPEAMAQLMDAVSNVLRKSRP